MVYKQVCLGMNLSHSGAGRVFWFHDECASKLSIVAGNNPEKTDEQPPRDAKCYICGGPISQNPIDPKVKSHQSQVGHDLENPRMDTEASECRATCCAECQHLGADCESIPCQYAQSHRKMCADDLPAKAGPCQLFKPHGKQSKSKKARAQEAAKGWHRS